jgi:hypothetical protein
MKLTPPGRGLAVLFMRESGLAKVTRDALSTSLPEELCENFGLAQTVDVKIDDVSMSVTLHSPHSPCNCEEGHPEAMTEGRLGCTVASFLAILFCCAAGSPVELERCARNSNEDTWTVSMKLASKDLVNQ